MKKALLILICLATSMATSMSLMAQEVTIPLMPGWNWISYPSTETVDFATAFGTFSPMEGDMIQSQFAIAEYDDGEWFGDFELFYPGYGYMYYSNRTMPVMLTFNAQQPAPQVVVTTSEPTDITTNSAICGGNVTSSSGDYVFVFLRGICWSTNPNPTFNDNYIEAGNGLGSFTVSMTELTPNTTYYVRAFAVTPSGTFYGEEVSFFIDYEYVDLGLPSGLLWATCNVGADSPEDYGDYFAWGETQPKDTYNWSTYQYCMGNYNTLTKYCSNPSYGYNGFTDNLTTLLPEDDAATANWGSGWRMPTQAEFQELLDNTTVTWTAQNGVYGRLFTASNGNSLFLPAAGYRVGSGLYDADSEGSYWSSSLGAGGAGGAWYLYFPFDDGYHMDNDGRDDGLSVRAVRSGSQNPSFIIDATANPAEGGVVTGGGSYFEGTECTLTATANEGYTFSNWTENDEVVSTEAIYTFTVNGDHNLTAIFYATLDDEHVVNGDFSMGNTGFTTWYQYNSNLTSEGTYYVDTNASLHHEIFHGYGHGDNGNFMIVNGATNPGTNVWTEQIPVQPYKYYIFSTWVCTLTDGSPALLQFSINGLQFDVFSSPSQTNIWQRFYVQWYSGSATVATITILNQNNGGDGNDFGLDDISFRELDQSVGGDHACIDLGLPSGTLWATCNVGADNPEDYGDYFAWGETQPKDYYDWSTYQYCMGGSGTLTKYCNNSSYGYNGFTDDLTTLLPEDDAATANWGADWRMPTLVEWEELYNNTSSIWTTQNGENGRLFTSSNGNSLFLPAAGCHEVNLYDVESYGYYWSSSLVTDYPYNSPLNAWILFIHSGYYGMNGYGRSHGRSVRPVRSASQN